MLERGPPDGLLGWLQESPEFTVDVEAADDDGETGLVDHLDHLLETIKGSVTDPLGPPPADLADVLVELAMAGRVPWRCVPCDVSRRSWRLTIRTCSMRQRGWAWDCAASSTFRNPSVCCASRQVACRIGVRSCSTVSTAICRR